MHGISIGAMSDKTGVNIETIRYYEKIGLMPEPGRTAGGNRQYERQHLKRLFFIRRSRNLGFSIAEIRDLLGMVDEQSLSCGEVHRITDEHLTSIRAKIADLKNLESILSDMAAQCARGDVPDCPIMDALFDPAS